MPIQRSRGKIQDLNSEIAQMTQEIETYNQESATYLTFEKRFVASTCMDFSVEEELVSTHSPLFKFT